MADDRELRRVNVVLYADQHDALGELGLNVSGLLRDLLGDYLSESKITLQVSDETRALYDRVIANTGSSDEELEPALRDALKATLARKIQEMQALYREL